MITYKDTCQLVGESVDGYGDKQIAGLTEIPCLFLQSSSNTHSNNADINTADAHIYLDPTNGLMLALGYKIEGKTLIVNTLGGANDTKDWYKVTKVVVGQRKLLDNDVDNVHAFLVRVAKVQEYVS